MSYFGEKTCPRKAVGMAPTTIRDRTPVRDAPPPTRELIERHSPPEPAPVAGKVRRDLSTHGRLAPLSRPRRRVRRVPAPRHVLGPPAALPDLRPCRLLRQLARPPRH